ncbi:MAG: element excision factor XisH family protein [Bacteroidota bacterium]
MAKDTYHDVFKNALEKDGWQITDDPYVLDTGSRKLRIDLGAERLIEAEKEGKKILVEVKSFIGLSDLHEFYKAVGQFDYYLFGVQRNQLDRKLYLAIPSDFYDAFIKYDAYNLDYIKDRKLALIVYDKEKAIILKWIE